MHAFYSWFYRESFHSFAIYYICGNESMLAAHKRTPRLSACGAQLTTRRGYIPRYRNSCPHSYICCDVTSDFTFCTRTRPMVFTVRRRKTLDQRKNRNRETCQGSIYCRPLPFKGDGSVCYCLYCHVTGNPRSSLPNPYNKKGVALWRSL